MTYSKLLFTAAQKQRRTALSYRSDARGYMELGMDDHAERYFRSFDENWQKAKRLLMRARQERRVERERMAG
ncbi:hypothetical protein ACFOLL_13150 [Falsochrobactrum ovis]|uniref:Uncharacterized protein n=1 Tax=Falsochrobactrum ovis TaxID=1293442 RepID=A0A364JTE0_9HYPH|nr:hypothetical protein [Falsochrobactrum ovis]RAK27065.1 hypothetical protein C7374_11159 [Falsochrobactrum ovis]